MQLGMIGLGRMGANLVRRLRRDGHDCVVYDVDPEAVAALEAEGATGATSLVDLAAKLTPPRLAWVMVPAAHAPSTIRAVAESFEASDIVIDGGNSHYRDAIGHAASLGERGVHFVDIGTSGGVHGLERGYCLMVGGHAEPVGRLAPLLDSLVPGVDAVARTPGRDGAPSSAERGWLHCGPPGAGHFVKMVHNGIEYGMMAAFAEGLNLLRHADAGSAHRSADAETAPLREPEAYRYSFDIAAISEVWRRGSVVGSWLLDLTAAALAANPTLDGYAGRVSDSGEGRWTVESAIELGVPVPVLSNALFSRFASRDNDRFANQVLSAMREQFGGHVETTAPTTELPSPAQGASPA
jgi:6-phosphogluconate dehydrogenase